MILCAGEILADLIAEQGNRYTMYCGGAPFNVAVNIAQAGGKAAFVGKVGRDVAGDFLAEESAKYPLVRCEILRDRERNTTLAFVALNKGERSFSFFRRDTADAGLCAEEVRLQDDAELTILHLGTLMLSEARGRACALALAESAARAGKLVSVDVNFREDLYCSAEEMIGAYRGLIARADILKFSEDELLLFADETDFARAVDKIYRRDTLLLVTCGARGSYYRCNGLNGFVNAEHVIPVDTTGAGDAFFGAALAMLDGVDFKNADARFFERLLQRANANGGAATRYKGAIRLTDDASE
jgi:fructokinase